MSERSRGMEPKTKPVGYKCNMPRCEWTVKKPLARWQALPLYGKHNNDTHKGTIHAHIVPVYSKAELGRK